MFSQENTCCILHCNKLYAKQRGVDLVVVQKALRLYSDCVRLTFKWNKLRTQEMIIDRKGTFSKTRASK